MGIPHPDTPAWHGPGTGAWEGSRLILPFRGLDTNSHIRQAEVRSFLHGQLPPGRAEELHNHLLAAGIPLGDHLSSGSNDLATG